VLFDVLQENTMLPTVTCWFIRGIIRNGRLTEARKRFEAGTARPNNWTFESASCWSVVCEEVIDTDHDPEGYDAVYAELIRRGFSADEIDEMRKLAWRTAGWLNYDMMVWDWCSMDESDMRRALELKFEKRLTRKTTYDHDLQMIQQFLDRDPPTTKKKTAEQAVHGNTH
jgi:hypothetical protein